MSNDAPNPMMVDALANIIREVDGNHDLGAGALAEGLISRGVRVAQPESGEIPEMRDGRDDALSKIVTIAKGLRHAPIDVVPTAMQKDITEIIETARGAIIRPRAIPPSEPSPEAIVAAALVLQWLDLKPTTIRDTLRAAYAAQFGGAPPSEGKAPPMSIPRIEFENNGREVWHSDDRYPMKHLPDRLTIEDGSTLGLYECTHCGVRVFAGLDAKRYVVVRAAAPQSEEEQPR